MVRALKVSVEKKTFLVRFEGEYGGIWCSLTKHSRDSVFALGFEKEEFASNKKSTFLVILEGEKGRGWEQLKNALFSMLVIPSLNIDEKGRQRKVESINHKHVGPLYRSFTNVVKEEGPRRGGLLPIRRWARAVVCECPADFVN
ncbi:hypothetical protein CK203_103817 [Vitis vinifera]|uniref:Uncharacterized protein n=1 Tax=Vitis vinifera TaxID=29760 RepID=A0A438CTL4_VITVI|nr:hypothetical protein CK203_103817 [Vitis vinifera]